MPNFPERLHTERKFQGLTLKQLGKKIDTEPSRICDYEQCRHEPTLFSLCCIADALHVTTDYLLGRTEKRN